METLRERFLGGWQLYFRCGACGRYRHVDMGQVGRLVGWDYDADLLARRISCARCRARGGMEWRYAGYTPPTWQPKAQAVIDANPARTVIPGPWRRKAPT